jgi:hypothetical protein
MAVDGRSAVSSARSGPAEKVVAAPAAGPPFPSTHNSEIVVRTRAFPVRGSAESRSGAGLIWNHGPMPAGGRRANAGVMTTMTAQLSSAEAVVLEYLGELWSHSEGLTPRLRDDLMATVARYISAHRPGVRDAAEVVRWLGPPGVLVELIRKGQLP